MPDEKEQYEAYKKVVKGMAGRPVTIRTFDLGNDKDINPEQRSATASRPTRRSGAVPFACRWPNRACFRLSYGPSCAPQSMGRSSC
jgi:phosphotransferase system enzyme I (PtsI)